MDSLKVLIDRHFHRFFDLETLFMNNLFWVSIEKCNQLEEQEVELARITMGHDLLRSEKERLENDLNGWYHSNYCFKCHICTANLIIFHLEPLLVL